jgi:hypothetical protein
MCTSKPKAPKPVPNAPVVSPVNIDEESLGARQDELRRQRQAYGRQSTILAGNQGPTGLPPTQPVKTALGQ